MKIVHLSVFGLTVLTLSGSAIAQAVPEKGRMICVRTSSHAVPVVEGSKEMIRTNAAECKWDNDPGNKNIYKSSHSVHWNEKGEGKLVYGGGGIERDGKAVNTSQTTDGTYKLLIKDKKVVGFEASGTVAWTAGELGGKTGTWTAGSIDKDSYFIEYAAEK